MAAPNTTLQGLVQTQLLEQIWSNHILTGASPNNLTGAVSNTTLQGLVQTQTYRGWSKDIPRFQSVSVHFNVAMSRFQGVTLLARDVQFVRYTWSCGFTWYVRHFWNMFFMSHCSWVQSHLDIFIYKYCRSQVYMDWNRHHSTFLKDWGWMGHGFSQDFEIGCPKCYF